MKRLGQKDGYTVYWNDPRGNREGGGEVIVGHEMIGHARTESEALQLAGQWISERKHCRPLRIPMANA